MEKQRQVLQEKVAQQHAAAVKAKQQQQSDDQKQRTNEQLKQQLEDQLKVSAQYSCTWEWSVYLLMVKYRWRQCLM